MSIASFAALILEVYPISFDIRSTNTKIDAAIKKINITGFFGNGGVYYEPMLYSKVEDSKGNVILEQDFFGTQAISPESAWIANRMIRTVVTDSVGTGRLAQLDNVEVVGKTGTSNDQKNLLFAGCTPDYVGIVWIGYDDSRAIGSGDGWRAVASIWKTLMEDIQDQSQTKMFIADSNVVERSYCTETGLIATSKCPKTAIGYYKADKLPATCDSTHKEGEYAKKHGGETLFKYDDTDTQSGSTTSGSTS